MSFKQTVIALLLCSLLALAQGVNECHRLNFLPMPREITCGK